MTAGDRDAGNRFRFADPDYWAARPRETLRRARRYSIFVFTMKAILPLTAAAVAAAVIGFALQPRENAASSVGFERLGTLENDLAMTNPKLTGTTEDGLPFVVKATRAVQEPNDMVRLFGVDGEVVLKTGVTVRMQAAEGLVYTKDRRMDMTNGITVTTDNGYRATTNSATADLVTGIVKGRDHIEGFGPAGRISAASFEVTNSPRVVTFTGNVHMFIDQAKTSRDLAIRTRTLP